MNTLRALVFGVTSVRRAVVAVVRELDFAFDRAGTLTPSRGPSGSGS
jgi:hypothetical protein